MYLIFRQISTNWPCLLIILRFLWYIWKKSLVFEFGINDSKNQGFLTEKGILIWILRKLIVYMFIRMLPINVNAIIVGFWSNYVASEKLPSNSSITQSHAVVSVYPCSLAAGLHWFLKALFICINMRNESKQLIITFES